MIWLVVLVIILLFMKSTWKVLPGMVRMLLSRQVLTVLIAMVLYVGLVVLILYDVHFWNRFLIKDTLFWFVGVAIILLFNVNKATEDGGPFFKRVILEGIGFAMVLAFLANLYSFPLWFEIILAPSITFLVLLSVLASTEEQYSSVKKLVDFVLAAFGFFLIGFTVYKMASNYHSFFTCGTLRTFVLPPLLTIAYLPFLYVCALYMVYDSMFVRIDGEDKALARVTRRKIMKLCNVHLKKLNRFAEENIKELIKLRNKNDVLKMIEDFGENYKTASHEDQSCESP